MTLATYAERFRRLNVNVAHGRASPHKICMLLAVLDLARGGALMHNRIEYAPPLLERYAMYFRAVRAGGDHPNPCFPFFHLAGRLRGGAGSFWHLQPKPGREAVLAGMSTARTARQVTDNIDHVRLDPALFELLLDQLLPFFRLTLAGALSLAFVLGADFLIAAGDPVPEAANALR